MNIYKGPDCSITNIHKQVDFEDKEYFVIFNYWRRYDFLSALFAFIGLLFAIINYEIDISNKDLIIYDVDLITTKYKDAMETDRFLDG